MEIPMGAISPLIRKLDYLLVGEFTLEKRVRKGVASLVRELHLLQAILRKLAKVPPEQLDEGVKIWAGRVGDLSYQMEDSVDAFLVGVGIGGEPTNPKNKVNQLLKKTRGLFKKGKVLHQISDALEESLALSNEFADLRQRYELETWDTGTGGSVDPPAMAIYTDVTELVGIEGPRDKLINMLTEGDDWSKHPLKTVSIVGFGGLGKTALATAVYHKIKEQFDCHAFVSVSRNPNMRKILKDILFQLDKSNYANIHDAAMDEQHLLDELIEFLRHKRYFIIIDDIWDEPAWQIVMCAFSKNSPGSRIITTTRIVSVSEACCHSSDDIYRMNPLSDDVSRRLFFKRVFPPEKGCPQELVQVSESILKKCGGIPLAIITLASLLANNHWIKTKDQWYDLLSSIGRGLTEDYSVKEMKKILLLSYYNLPSHLKLCLLYLSIFPEDHKIMRDDLIWKWISEGFIYSDKQVTSLYELGNMYFNELVNRSVIQPIGIDDEGEVEACLVHDMMHDLICSVSSEENFVTTLDGAERKMPNTQSKVRRLSIQNSKVHVDTTRMAQVRSLFFANNLVGLIMPNISSFQVLRVLDLDGCDISDIRYVGNLLQLRYLGLRRTHVEDLPRELGKLQFLLTLDIRSTWIKVLPSSIVQLRRLMCLYVDYHMKLPYGIGNLTSLEVLGELGVFDKDIDVVKELGHLTKLRVLQFCLRDLNESLDKASVESIGKAMEESLGNLYKLDSLSICLPDGCVNFLSDSWVPPQQLRSLIFMSTFKTLPAWINPWSFPVLTCLHMSVDKVGSKDIQLLGMLPALCSLALIGGAGISGGDHVVEVPVLSSGALLFPCMRECYFLQIVVVPCMFPQGAAPRLKHLAFAFPAKWISGENFDLGMRHLPSLQQVNVEVICEEASGQELDGAEAALRAAAEDHPNRPVLEIVLARA